MQRKIIFPYYDPAGYTVRIQECHGMIKKLMKKFHRMNVLTRGLEVPEV
jgi:hypothetical protein